MNENTPKDPRISNKFYDAMKFLALILLPAAGAAYFSLAQIWDLPKPGEVVGTITVIDTFLGVILKLSSSSYHNGDSAYDGTMNVLTNPDGGLTYDLSLNGDPAALAGQKAVSFKVQTPVETNKLE